MALKLLSDDQEIRVLDSELVDDGDATVVYTVRKITPEKQRELFKKHTRQGTHRRQESVNYQALQDDQVDYVLAAWEGVNDGTQPAACNRVNKLRLDVVRKVALIDRAGMAEIVAAEDAKKDSFRSPS
jgi:hypothetical protein